MPQIHKPGVLARLQRRLGLDLSSSDTLQVAYDVQPITNADDLLKRIEGSSGNLSFSGGATSWVTGLTVPQDERWTIKSVNFYRNSGDNMVDQIALLSVVTGAYCVIATGTAVASVYATILGVPITLGGGDQVLLHSNGTGSSASVFVLNAWTEIESIF